MAGEQRPAEFGNHLAAIRNYRGSRHHDYWLGPEHPDYAWALCRLVKHLQPSRVLELGVQSGGSAYGLISTLPDDAVYVGIDNEGQENAVAGGATSTSCSREPTHSS